MKINEKLLSMQSRLIAPKNNYNSCGKYNYRSCEDILEGLKPLLKETKTILTLSDEVLQIGDRFYLKAIARLTDVETGESTEVSALAREDEILKGMSLAQITGSVSSYARKYALNGLFCIDDTKDPDATNEHGKGKPKDDFKPKEMIKPKDAISAPNGQVISKGQAKRMYAISKGNVDLIKQVMSEHSYKDSSEVEVKDYKKICEEIEQSVAAQEALS